MLGFSQVGYYFFLRNSQQEWKENVKENILAEINSKELTTISFSDNQQKIYWEEEGKEFSLNGEMYDVVKSSVVNGKVILYCINDKKEQQLIDHYNSVTKHNSSSDKKGKNTVDNLINLFVYLEEDNVQHLNISSNTFYSFISPIVKNIAGKVSPPPKA